MTVDKRMVRRVLRRDRGICWLCGKAGASEVDQVDGEHRSVHKDCRWKRAA